MSLDILYNLVCIENPSGETWAVAPAHVTTIHKVTVNGDYHVRIGLVSGETIRLDAKDAENATALYARMVTLLRRSA